ncbi:MAG: radical SAM protein [Promethearchaeota archaeon]
MARDTNGIFYAPPVFRPPSEARSLLIQATIGCTFRCAFCVSNLGKKFEVRPVEDIVRDLETARRAYGRGVRRVFFLDGNAMVMPFDQLLEITKAATKLFPQLERVAVYAHARDVLGKTSEELRALADAGLKMAYLGIESGNAELLQKVNKRVTPDELVSAAHRLHEAGITLSGTIILGLAGRDPELSRAHALDTARVVNLMCPEEPKTWYISTLALMVPPGTPVARLVGEGEFVPMSDLEIVRELELMLSHIDDGLHSCVFRSNHASNYLALKGVLAKDKAKLLGKIRRALEDPSVLRPEFFRGL